MIRGAGRTLVMSQLKIVDLVLNKNYFCGNNSNPLFLTCTSGHWILNCQTVPETILKHRSTRNETILSIKGAWRNVDGVVLTYPRRISGCSFSQQIDSTPLWSKTYYQVLHQDNTTTTEYLDLKPHTFISMIATRQWPAWGTKRKYFSWMTVQFFQKV
jgi:hypothetical protein